MKVIYSTQHRHNDFVGGKKTRTLHKLLLMTTLCHIQLTFFSSYLICFIDWWWSSRPSLHILQDKHFQPTHQSVTFLTFYDPLQFSQSTSVGRAGYTAIGFLTLGDKQDGLHPDFPKSVQNCLKEIILYTILVGWGFFKRILLVIFKWTKIEFEIRRKQLRYNTFSGHSH